MNSHGPLHHSINLLVYKEPDIDRDSSMPLKNRVDASLVEKALDAICKEEKGIESHMLKNDVSCGLLVKEWSFGRNLSQASELIHALRLSSSIVLSLYLLSM